MRSRKLSGDWRGLIATVGPWSRFLMRERIVATRKNINNAKVRRVSIVLLRPELEQIDILFSPTHSPTFISPIVREPVPHPLRFPSSILL